MERAVALASINFIEVEDLSDELQYADLRPKFFDNIIPLYDMEREYILHALRTSEGDKAKVASKLGMGISTLYKKLKEYKEED